MKFEVVLNDDCQGIRDKLTQLSLVSRNSIFTGFSLNPEWDVVKDDEYFELSKPYGLFGKSDSNFIAKIKLEEPIAVIEIRFKIFTLIVLFTALVFCSFFLLSAILDGMIIGYITLFFPFIYYCSITKERKIFTEAVKQFLTNN